MNRPVVNGHTLASLPLLNFQEMSPSPKVVTLARDKPLRTFADLASKSFLLITDPAKASDGIGASHFDPRISRCNECDATFRRMNREVDILYRFSGYGDR